MKKAKVLNKRNNLFYINKSPSQSKIKSFNFFIFFSLILISNISYCQQDAVASGSVATGVGGTVCYSIGQIDYANSNGAGGIVTQGVQQPYEIYITTGLEEMNVNILVSTSPNPTNESIVLTLESLDLQNVSYQLYDSQGKLLSDNKVTDNNSTIQMSELPSALYFIKVLNQNKEIKTFKIIKN